MQVRRDNNFKPCIFVWNIDAAGGMERQAWRLAVALHEKGIQPIVVSSKVVTHFDYEKKFPYYKETLSGIKLYRIPVKPMKFIAMGQFCLISFLLLLFLKKKYDVIYAVQLYSSGAIASLAGKLLNKPVVVKVACGGYCGDISMFSKLPLGWLAKRFAQWADAYVSLSKQIEEELKDAGFDEGEIVHIPNGIDTSVFYSAGSIEEKKELRKKLSLPDKKIVTFVGRLDPQKRADLLVEVFKKVHRLFNSAYLVIIGDGPERKKLEEMADENILIKGVVSNVAEYLRASDLLVLPSLAEGMSNVILEAMATGLPVITTDVSSNPEVIDNGIDGVLLDPEDKSGFKKNILKILTDESFASKIGQNAREKVVEKFSMESIAEKYRELFDRLVNRRKT